jgi:c-di-GMP-binding flagellar brake protein YcgR
MSSTPRSNQQILGVVGVIGAGTEIKSNDGVTDFPPATDGSERRKHTRMYVRKPCKIFHRQTRQYLAASTHDFSIGGAMVWLESARPLTVGDEIELIVGWGASAIVTADAGVVGQVLRVLPMSEGKQAAAIRFKTVQDGVVDAARKAA